MRGNKRPGFTPQRKLRIARRDGLVYAMWGTRGPCRIYRCAVCRHLVRQADASIGHIKALLLGGTNDDTNLRIECLRCNFTDNALRQGHLVEKAARVAEKMLDGTRRSHSGRHFRVYGNVPASSGSRVHARVLRRRADRFVARGYARVTADGGVELFGSRARLGLPEIIENHCARCGLEGPVRRFLIVPNFLRLINPSVLDAASLCPECTEHVEIAYAAEITRHVAPVVARFERERDALICEKKLAPAAGAERAAIVTARCRAFQWKVVHHVVAALEENPIDFRGLFWRILHGDVTIDAEDVPALSS